MYYELYIDILYLVNFMMDFFILILVKEITKSATTYKRITLASLISALLTCVVIVLPIPYGFIKFILFHIVITTVMIRIGFKIKEKRAFLKCLITVYFASFLLGGVCTYFQQYLKVSSLFFAMVILSFWIVKGLWGFASMLQSNRRKWCQVELYILDQVITVNALFDTGNILRDPYTGKPVSVVEQSCIHKELLENPGTLFALASRYIPYHSLGNQGMMLAIKIKKMHIRGDSECWIDSPIIALSEEGLSLDHSYQMILNPDIL